MIDVHLVCMPFQIEGISSLSTALLSAILRQNGLTVAESYLHFEFARLLGSGAYRSITEGDTEQGLLGELLFAESECGFVEDEARQVELTGLFGTFAERSRLLAQFREHCLEAYSRSPAPLVGFTTSFNQLLPSIWLARAIKSRYPGVRVVFGGAGCAWPMGEVVREAYPEIDYIICGNGERLLPELALRLENHPPGGVFIDQEPVDLDALPIPDYRAFAEHLRRYERPPDKVMLSYESSRGCWWGERHQCSFCGINGAQMRFLAKSSRRALEEIRELWDTYHLNLMSSDSVLSREHLREMMPALASYTDRPGLFYEVKPNLGCEEVRLLKAGGVWHIQPGIESLNSNLLRLLNKGTRTIQNLALLKWCREAEIKVSWNLLLGIPGESADEYFAQVELIERIPHLPPPCAAYPVRIDRFSPYFQQHRQFGWEDVRPMPLYYDLHRGKPERLIRGMAYHFDGIGGSVRSEAYDGQVHQAVERWKQRHAAGDGLFFDASLGLFEMSGGEVFGYQENPLLKRVLELSHEIIGVDQLQFQTGIPDSSLRELIDANILYREGNQVLNLAIRLD